MSIWTYGEGSRKTGEHYKSEHFDFNANCVFCDSPMIILGGDELPSSARKGLNCILGTLLGCPICGWWMASSLRGKAPFESSDGGFIEFRQISGVLKNLDTTDISIPIDNLRSLLVAKYSERFDVHPKKYEDIVGGVFSDFGYRVRVTSYTGDKGIDAFVLDGENDTTVGIQVKRHRGNIYAEQLRAFVGALAIRGITTGIFITTSNFGPSARQVVDDAEKRLGIIIELYDAKRFYEALKISTRTSFWNLNDPDAPYYEYWQAIKEYINGPPLPDGQLARNWLDKAEYVWGSGW